MSQVCVTSLPPSNLQTIFPAEIITIIFEFWLESPAPIKLLNRLHGEPTRTRKKSDRMKCFWEEAEGIFHGMLSSQYSVVRDTYRARFFQVNTFIVNRTTEYKRQPADNGEQLYVGSILNDWPESYQHIRSLIIDGKNIPVKRRDAISRACPNLIHLKILDLRYYVPETFEIETAMDGRGAMYAEWQERARNSSKSCCWPPWGRGFTPRSEDRLLEFVEAYPKLRHLELECENYYTARKGEQSDAGWFTSRIACRALHAFCDVQREIRIEVVGEKGLVIQSLYLPTESGEYRISV